MILEAVIFVLTLLIGYHFFKADKNLPPGPWPIPIFGNLPLVFTDDAIKMSRKYGDIFATRLGAVRMVFITDFKKAKEAFSKIELADRVSWKIFKLFDDEDEIGGVIFSNGLRWHNTRRFLLRHLRDMGMGKSKLEGTIMREIENLVEDFKSLTKEPSKLPFSINVTILNVIWQLVASHRYKFNSPEVEDFMNKMKESEEYVFASAALEFFPFLKYIIPKPILDYVTNKKVIQAINQGFADLVQPFIDDHVAKLDPDHPADLMDEYLIEMKEKKSKEYSHFSNKDLIKTTFDLFVAGNDTTATMTQWVLFYMAKFPHIQKKIQALIDEVVPSDRLPGLEHKEKLTYVDAVINEVQRHATLVPFGVMRAANKDITFYGYDIPKGTMVQSVAEMSHKDPTYWKNPAEVDPTRFLDSNGKFIPSREGFQPFGLGRRQCLGEQFARMELFLIVAALLQNFTFNPPEGEEIDIAPKKVPGINRPSDTQKFLIKLRR